MSEKCKIDRRTLSPSNLRKAGATATVATLASACTQTGYDTGNGAFYINCSSGSKPYASYVFVNNNPSDRTEFTFSLAESSSSAQATVVTAQGGEYTTDGDLKDLKTFNAGDKITGVSDDSAEVMAGEYDKSTGEWVDADISFTLSCTSQPLSLDTPGKVAWQSIPQ